MNSRRQNDAYRLSLSALLLALMLVLGYVESLFPTGVPGMKIGLSNSVLIFAVYMMDIPSAYILMALKVLLSGLMFSGVSAMMYAFAGGLVSLTLMALLSRSRKISPIAVSMAGGVSHNLGQVAVAILVLSPAGHMLYYLAFLTAAGLAGGLATGVAANIVMKRLPPALRRFTGPQESRKTGILLISLAAVLTAAGLFLAYNAMKSAAPAAPAPAQTGDPSPLISPDVLPFKR